MKLAEALILRADCQKRIAQLQQRLARSARVQEGEQPPEDPQELLQELDEALAELLGLIQRINRTNAVTRLGDRSLSDVLAERDVMWQRRLAYDALITAAAFNQDRYLRSELRFVSTVDVAALQQQTNRLSKDYRELDTQIQALNWSTDLLES